MPEEILRIVGISVEHDTSNSCTGYFSRAVSPSISVNHEIVWLPHKIQSSTTTAITTTTQSILYHEYIRDSTFGRLFNAKRKMWQHGRNTTEMEADPGTYPRRACPGVFQELLSLLPASQGPARFGRCSIHCRWIGHAQEWCRVSTNSTSTHRSTNRTERIHQWKTHRWSQWYYGCVSEWYTFNTTGEGIDERRLVTIMLGNDKRTQTNTSEICLYTPSKDMFLDFQGNCDKIK